MTEEKEERSKSKKKMAEKIPSGMRPSTSQKALIPKAPRP
jgi:hypothetical protein